MKQCRSVWSCLALYCLLVSIHSASAGNSPLASTAFRVAGASEAHSTQAREYLKSILYSRKQVTDWISGRLILYGETYDSQLGWVLADRRYKDGVDGSISTYRYSGARRMINYADSECRINTYGDSFTHCDQVSDGETWQEVLAAHLCEPIRNFGVGGYSVYQSYLRMRREETRTPASYIIFNIFDDDHYRNLHGWRNIRLGYRTNSKPGVTSPSMPYVEVNPSTGQFSEFSNPCPTRGSVYNLSDLDWVYDRFGDDFVLKIILAGQNLRENSPEKSYKAIQELARQHGIQIQLDSPETLRRTVQTLHTRAGLFASMRIVERVEKFANDHGKKVLYVLSYGGNTVVQTIREGARFDQEFVDFLEKQKLPYVDLMKAHLSDFAKFNLPIGDYTKRYWVGHYNPLGNVFQAFAIKDRLVEILQPKPTSYTTDNSVFTDPELLRFPGRDLAQPDE